jgi:hypothetical protein
MNRQLCFEQLSRLKGFLQSAAVRACARLRRLHCGFLTDLTRVGITGRRFECGEIAKLPAEYADNPTQLVDLEAHHCRWPCSGEGAETLFCGGRAVSDLSYCLRHCMLAYQFGSMTPWHKANSAVF